MSVDNFLMLLFAVCVVVAILIIKKGKKGSGKRTTWIDETIGMGDD